MLNPASELLWRNHARLLEYSADKIILVNPPADDLASQLNSTNSSETLLQSNDYQIYQYFKRSIEELKLTVEFTSKGGCTEAGKTNLAIIYLPREKAYLDYLLAHTSTSLNPGDRIWLVGANRSGIKSTGKRLQKISNAVNKLDSARHCSLFEIKVNPDLSSALMPAASSHAKFALEFNQQDWEFTTLPGVFSYGSLDPATRMLLNTLQQLPVKGRVLDFACGCGVIGLTLMSLSSTLTVDLLDVNAMALASTEINIQKNNADTDRLEIIPSDGFSGITKTYTAIVSNPPFHRHSRQSFEVSEELILQAPRYLTARGELRIVANKHLPYLKLFQQSFAQVDILAEDNFFQVIRGSRPKTKLNRT